MLDEIAETGLRDRFLALRAMPFSAALDDQALLLVSEHARNRRLEKGEVLLRPGRPVESMFVVLDGQVTITVNGHVLSTAQKNMAVGVTSMLARDPEGASAVADEDSEVLEMPAEALLAAYREDFSLVRNLLRLQARGILQLRDSLPKVPGGDPPVVGPDREGTLSLVERVFRIRQSAIFADANLDAIFELARHTDELRIPRGQMLWERGDPPRFWVQIERGLAYCENAEGSSSVVGAGFVLGTLDCWASLGHAYSARAETDMIVHRVNLEPMLGVLETHHDLAMEIVAIVSRTRINAAITDG